MAEQRNKAEKRAGEAKNTSVTQKFRLGNSFKAAARDKQKDENCNRKVEM